MALASPRVRHHARAAKHARAHLEAGGRWIGTALVLGELHGLLVFRAGPGRATQVVRDLHDDPAYEWVDVSAELVREVTERWLARFPDRPFTLADAVSFEVMRRRKVRQAFAYDRHFTVAGFEVVG